MNKHIILNECTLTFDASIGECALVTTNGAKLFFPMSQDAWSEFLHNLSTGIVPKIL